MKTITRTARRLAPLLLSVGLVMAGTALSTAKELLTINLVNEPATLDPHQQWNPDSYYVYRNIFDNMLTRDNAGEIVPQIATSWDQVSDTEIVFDLRDDVVFHDGEKLTAEDVVYTVERITNPDFASPQLGQFNKIIKAEALGDYKVKLTTDGPYPALLAQLVKLSIVPQHVASTMSSEEFNAAPVGSGPYKLSKWERGVEVVVEKNDAYWGDKGPFDTVAFRGVPDASTRMANLQAGAADLVVTLNADLAQQLEASGRGKVLNVNTERVAYFAMNSTLPPLDNVELRRAIGYAIDREAIVEGLLGGFPEVVDQHACRNCAFTAGRTRIHRLFAHDPEKAMRSLPVFAMRRRPRLKLATSPSSTGVWCRQFSKCWTEVGLNCSRSKPVSTWPLRGCRVSRRPAMTQGRRC